MISGVLWGASGYLLNAIDFVNPQILLYVIVIGTTAASIMVTAYWLPGFYAYSFPAVVGIGLNLIIQGDATGKSLGVLFLLFLLMLIRVAKQSHETAYDAIRLRFKNLELVENLQKEKEKVELASQAKTRFLASANHDLRQPVHATSLLIHALDEEITSSRGKVIFNDLKDTTESLNKLLESLLDLSRLDASAVNVSKSIFATSDLYRQMLIEFLPIAKEKDLRFSVFDTNKVIYTDRTLLERVIRNLLNNAFRYTESGGVLLGCRTRQESLIIEVWDTGTGINETEQDKIMTEFYQASLSKKHEQGLGLGLAICRKISELLDHEFTFDSVENRGSVFRLRVPLSPVQLRQFTPPTSVEHKMLANKGFLIIDDEPTVLLAMQHVLESWQAHAFTAENGAAALILLEQNTDSIDAIICDNYLANDESGIELIKQITARPEYSHLPALIITGDTSPDQLQRLEQTELPFMHKPVLPEQLYSELQKLLREPD